MNIPKKDRVTLKSYFVKNAIPTEGNFGDLIDGLINQVDDGLVKLPGDPLALEASGDAGSPLKILQLYRDFAEAEPDWVLSLAPRSDAKDAASGKAGLAISDGAGKHHLFLEQSRGRLGVGTVEPKASLHVQGSSDVSLSGGGLLVLGPTSGANLAMDGNEILARKNGAASPIYLQTDGGDLVIHDKKDTAQKFTVKDSGAVGIGTSSPASRLQILGGTDAGLEGGGYLVLGDAAKKSLIMDDNEIQARNNGATSPLYLQNDGGDLVIQGGQFVVKSDGKVGLGTKNPKAQLDVNGDVFVKGQRPFVIRRFKSFTRFKSTGMSTSDWAAAIVGFAALGGDINEKGKVDIIKLFVYKESGKWSIRANFASRGGEQEKWTVDVLFIRKELASQEGSWKKYA